MLLQDPTNEIVSFDHHRLNGTLALPAAFTETTGLELVLMLGLVGVPVDWGLLRVPFGAKVVEVDSSVALEWLLVHSEAMTIA